MVIGGVGLCRGRHDDTPDIAGFLELPGLHVSIVVGMKHHLYAAPLVFAVEFRVAEIVTDQQPAADAANGEIDKARPGTIVRQVAAATARIAGAEELVVARDQFAPLIDHVEAVVRLVPAGEPVTGSQDHPQAQPAREIHDLQRAAAQQLPVVVSVVLEIDARVPAERGFVEMDHLGAPPPGFGHLASDPDRVRADLPATRELACGDREFHARPRAGVCRSPGRVRRRISGSRSPPAAGWSGPSAGCSRRRG